MTDIYTVAIVAKWLTHRIVVPAFVGSIPISRPINFETVNFLLYIGV